MTVLAPAKGFVDTAAAIAADGFKTVDPAPRLVTCAACDKFSSGSRQCRVCWCFVDLKAKFRAARCPVGKW